jgi:hypothetical protein
MTSMPRPSTVPLAHAWCWVLEETITAEIHEPLKVNLMAGRDSSKGAPCMRLRTLPSGYPTPTVRVSASSISGGTAGVT